MRKFYEVATEKDSSDQNIYCLGELHDEHPKQWYIRVDKGYQGAQ